MYPRPPTMRSNGRPSIIIILNYLFIITATQIGLSYCDHLQQTHDEQTNEHARPLDKSQQPADPEYIRRELRDIIKMKIDSDSDGQVSYEELKKYLSYLHEKSIEYNVDKQWTIYSPQIHEVFSWEGYEPERKEVLTWDHYFNQTYPELIGVDVGIPINREQDTSRILNSPENPEEGDKGAKEKSASKKEETIEADEEGPRLKMLKLMVLRADARWKLADENGDTLLTKPEFKHLLHPDEGNEELQSLFIREATEDMDLDKDGKICLEEFMKHMQILASEQERNDSQWMSGQQENFGRFLDKNRDGLLEGDEIKNWLVPPKSKKFDAEAKRLLDIGDSNEDHYLTSAEILDNYEQFLTLLPPEYWQITNDLEDPFLQANREGDDGAATTTYRDEL